MDKKKVIIKITTACMSVLPVIAAMAIFISANSTASPFIGQSVTPKSLKKYRKF